MCRALNKYNCGQNLLTSTLRLVEHKEQHLVLNCSSMSGMNHRTFHWQCTGRCWSSTQCWNQLREAQTLNVLWLCWDTATRRMFFIPLSPSGGLISLVIYKSPTILYPEYTAGALCQSPMHDLGAWKKVWLSGAGVGGLQGSSVSYTLVCSDIALSSTQAFLYVWYFRTRRQLKSYNWVNIYVKAGCICICWTTRNFPSLTQIIFDKIPFVSS